jgi:hypothetical protein
LRNEPDNGSSCGFARDFWAIASLIPPAEREQNNEALHQIASAHALAGMRAVRALMDLTGQLPLDFVNRKISVSYGPRHLQMMRSEAFNAASECPTLIMTECMELIPNEFSPIESWYCCHSENIGYC